MSMRTYKYRLYPNKEQAEKLEWTLARCCEVYNACLQERRDRYEIAIKRHPQYYDLEWRKQATREHAISLYDQHSQLSPMKQERPEYLELSAAHLLNNVCDRVDKAFKGFFRRVKAGQKAGYPRFHSHKRYDSFCYPDSRGWRLEGKKLRLTRIGDIKIKLHRPIGGVIKTVTVKREGQHWYVTFCCEVERKIEHHPSEEAVGIDLGITHFAALSTGDFIDNPRYYRRAEKQLQAAQQSLSRKKKKDSRTGCKGNRRKKAIKAVAKAYRKVRKQRQDFLHKTSRKLVTQYQTMVFEDLQPANLSKRPKPKQDEETGQYLPNGAAAKSGLNKSINDAGWATFVRYCTYKAEWAGGTVIQVNPKYTSQTCSQCGVVKKKELSERWHSCECGCFLDRDHNAAMNILALGRRVQVSA